ncbi:phosphodiesterase [Aeromonas salmonicida subsp. salmonicida A449]|uniref:Phosphodiesterase n=1 Tax=Aeromonas salmonicida (strain A449) TaxID=382245 RepID=A4SL03_AERS4|nr:phosphodiesterase [Aeromonas salmonicida subsp. salmonicida A449]
MKIAIISDLHGSLSALEQVLAQLAPWQPDHYLLLGDLLNHGPRNPVPPGYAPAAVAERLNQLAPHIMAVRGNCDSEVDQMLLNFPMTAPYNQLLVDGRRWFVSHGHLYRPDADRCPPAACLSAATPIYPCCSEKGSWC